MRHLFLHVRVVTDCSIGRACGVVRNYDGIEDCLLVQTEKYAFTYELLMDYSAKFVHNHRVTFYGFVCGPAPLCMHFFHGFMGVYTCGRLNPVS